MILLQNLFDILEFCAENNTYIQHTPGATGSQNRFSRFPVESATEQQSNMGFPRMEVVQLPFGIINDYDSAQRDDMSVRVRVIFKLSDKYDYAEQVTAMDNAKRALMEMVNYILTAQEGYTNENCLICAFDINSAKYQFIDRLTYGGNAVGCELSIDFKQYIDWDNIVYGDLPGYPTFCDKVDECLSIPTADGDYILTITDGVKSWSEYSPTGQVVISKTQAEFLALVSGSTLEFPATYKITDIQNGLYINTLSANTYSNECSLSFLAPDYTLHTQYHYTDGALANNAIVTWGGFYWQNTSGGSATPNLPSERTIDNTGAFTQISKSVANGYVAIELNVVIQVFGGSIYITSAKDDKNNYIEQSVALQFNLGWQPLEVNQWNITTIIENKVLVCNNRVYYISPVDLSFIQGNFGNYSYSQESPYNIARISQNKLTGQFSYIENNTVNSGSIIYRNQCTNFRCGIKDNYLTSKCEIQGNIISGGFYNNTYPIILAMALDGRAKCNDNVLSGDGVAILNCHGHEETKINGNTLSGNGAKITHIIQKFLDECNDNTLSGQDTRIKVCNQDYGTKINGHTLAQTGEYIKQLKLTECELTNGTTAIHRLDVSGKDIDLTGFTQPIYDENISANSGFFTIEHNFTSSPLNSGSSVLYNIIPFGSSIVSLTASGALTGTTIEIGLETDAEGLINESVGLLPLTWSGVSAAATANRSLKIKATGGNITAGTLTVKVEFTI